MKLLPLALLLCSCASREVVVDVSEGRLRAPGFSCDVHTSRVGVGSRLGSNRTPLGEFTVTKEARHRYGPVLRLSGYQGHTRGILVHQASGPTSGCIGLDRDDMRRLFRQVSEGDTLRVKM